MEANVAEKISFLIGVTFNFTFTVDSHLALVDQDGPLPLKDWVGRVKGLFLI